MVSPYKYTLYPSLLDNNTSLPAFVDLKTPVRAEEGNRLREAILAIEGELGLQPSGTYASVRARLDALEASGGGGGGSSIAMAQDTPSVSAAQTVFNMVNTPINQQSTELFIDGISMTVGVDYTVIGNVLTYSGTPALDGTEDVVIKYLYTP